MRALTISLIVLVFSSAALGEPPLPEPRHGGIYVVAHRGAHIGIPENTLAAYQKAIDLGCDYIEIDVRTTKDGHYVSIHNKDVDAYTQDATGLVKDFTLAELQALDIGSRIDPKWKNERVPTFEDILKLCQGKIGIYLDLKDAPVEPLLKLIRKYDMEEDVLWYGSWDAQDRVRELCESCHPMPDQGPIKMLPKLFKRFPDVKVIASVWRFYSHEFAKMCHEQGAIVICDEDASDPAEWQQALDWEVDGIQTDDPEALIKFLQQRAIKP